ncbi:MAG: hypothetical protein ACOY3I_00375 [Verrucomicrobiota bacterium]
MAEDDQNDQARRDGKINWDYYSNRDQYLPSDYGYINHDRMGGRISNYTPSTPFHNPSSPNTDGSCAEIINTITISGVSDSTSSTVSPTSRNSTRGYASSRTETQSEFFDPVLGFALIGGVGASLISATLGEIGIVAVDGLGAKILNAPISMPMNIVLGAVHNFVPGAIVGASVGVAVNRYTRLPCAALFLMHFGSMVYSDGLKKAWDNLTDTAKDICDWLFKSLMKPHDFFRSKSINDSEIAITQNKIETGTSHNESLAQAYREHIQSAYQIKKEQLTQTQSEVAAKVKPIMASQKPNFASEPTIFLPMAAGLTVYAGGKRLKALTKGISGSLTKRTLASISREPARIK